jgi:oxygen-independent coproporphyrinogen-3 oxidase
MDMNAIVGSHDILFVTLDTLRYDVAASSLAAGRTPALAGSPPAVGSGEAHAGFTYAAHHPRRVPADAQDPGPHPRRGRLPAVHRRCRHLILAGGRGDRACWRGPTPCISGVGFFNRRSALGSVLPDLSRRALGAGFGVTDPDSTRHQVDRIEHVVRSAPPGPLFLFPQRPAMHQPNRFYVPGTADSCELTPPRYVCGWSRGAVRGDDAARPACFVIVCPTTARPTGKTDTSVTGWRTNASGRSRTRISWCAMLDGSPYQGYLYAYPHKTAYRPLRPRPALHDVWASEDRGSLALYVHVPFCEMRCGFCNLFTRSNPPAQQVRRYLDQLQTEAKATREALGTTRFSVGAIGGGTPTYLTAAELSELIAIVADVAGGPLGLAVETSPATATADRLEVLSRYGTERVSIGVQSFLDAEAHAAGRPQRRADVDRALATIRDAGIPMLNIDLIYGIDGQTPQTWEESITAALAWRPEELYLYPLYVRPLTGLDRRGGTHDDWDRHRLDLYRRGRDLLRKAGYRQLSMRHFRRDDISVPGTDYSCQDDGTVGLGCGARSYTRRLHYSYEYAVSVRGVRAVLDAYLARTDFDHAEVGFALDAQEQRRRWLVKTLLHVEGTPRAGWAQRFGDDVLDAFPALERLVTRGWAAIDADRIWLTEEGLSRSDAIGPWLVSPGVRQRMGEYTLR